MHSKYTTAVCQNFMSCEALASVPITLKYSLSIECQYEQGILNTKLIDI